MAKEIGIYKIQNRINGKIYIGQSRCISKRWNNHKSAHEERLLHLPLYKAFAKYGIENFSFEVVESCLTSELNEKERYWISYYNSMVPNGYNSTPGGQDGHSNIMTNELYSKIVDMLKTTSYSTDEIGDIVGISGSMVRSINRGDSWVMDDIEYPIRTQSVYRKLVSKDKLRPIDSNIQCGKRVCGVCSSVFQSRSKGQKYCSIKCSHIAQMKNGCIPTRDDLIKDILQLKSLCAVGRKYNVTGNSVKKWCRKLRIPVVDIITAHR